MAYLPRSGGRDRGWAGLIDAKPDDYSAEGYIPGRHQCRRHGLMSCHGLTRADLPRAPWLLGCQAIRGYTDSTPDGYPAEEYLAVKRRHKNGPLIWLVAR